MQPDTKRHVSQSRRGGSQHREEEHKRGLDPKHVRDCSLSSQCACFRLHTIHSTRVPSPTSKTAPNPSVFNAFYFQMCFAPQRRALFNINFQKVLCTFSLRNRLRAATACTFSSLISPDVSALATLASLLFNPPEPQNH